MKKVFFLALIMMLAFAFTGCSGDVADYTANKTGNTNVSVSKEDSESNNTNEEENKEATGTALDEVRGYAFTVNDTRIGMNVAAEDTLKALGDPINSTQSKSCAFDGMDRTYTYGGYEIATYEDSNGTETILSVTITDDTVNTEEGIYIGASKDQVTESYGDGEEDAGNLVYTKNPSTLTFSFDDDGNVSGIEYRAITN